MSQCALQILRQGSRNHGKTNQIIDRGRADRIDQIDRNVDEEHGENEGQHLGEDSQSAASRPIAAGCKEAEAQRH